VLIFSLPPVPGCAYYTDQQQSGSNTRILFTDRQFAMRGALTGWIRTGAVAVVTVQPDVLRRCSLELIIFL
jgi:hypothetical protein